MKPIIWLDESGLREYQPRDAKRIFKWVLFEREGVLYLAAMTERLRQSLHVHLVTEVAFSKSWYTREQLADAYDKRLEPRALAADMGVTVLGGGTKKDGKISDSFHFGPIPPNYAAEVQTLLGY